MKTTKIQEILNILMKWSFEQKEWHSVYTLYTLYNVGIPTRFLYAMRQKQVLTMKDVNDGENIYTNDIHLRHLLCLFSRSWWMRLEEWNNSYGYRFHKKTIKNDRN